MGRLSIHRHAIAVPQPALPHAPEGATGPKTGAVSSHLPGLGGIRFIAAACVVAHHIKQVKMYSGSPLALQHDWESTIMLAIGPRAVHLFFVLSGYLITYLLLRELDRKKDIDVLAFYVRRILRIWPLYYTVMFCGFVVVPWLIQGENIPPLIKASNAILDEWFPQYVALCLAMFPNLALQYGAVFMVSVSWSLGIEEQFYLVWPWFVRMTKRFFPAALVGFLCIKQLILPILRNQLVLWLPDTAAAKVAIYGVDYISRLPIDFMVYGALGAYLLHHHVDFTRKYLQNQLFGIVCIGMLVAGLMNKLGPLTGPAFTLVLLNVTSGRLAMIPMENRVLNYLGDRSYSLYFLHTPSIEAAVWLAGLLPLTKVSFSILVYPLSFAIAQIVSGLSFRYLESPFLRLKRRWS